MSFTFATVSRGRSILMCGGDGRGQGRAAVRQASTKAGDLDRPGLLIVSTENWLWPVKLAHSFATAGLRVATSAPKAFPLHAASLPGGAHVLSRLNPLSTLAKALEASGVRAVIPCDDRAVWHLKRLHQRRELYFRDPEAGAALIEQSLGDGVRSDALLSRIALLDTAHAEGIRAPASMAIWSEADLDAWEERIGYPAFLKADGTVGGRGVIEVASRSDALRALSWQRSPVRIGKELAKQVLGRGGAEFWDWAQRRERATSIQAAVLGHPANILVACHHGSVLASIGVEVLETAYRNGPALQVRVSENKDMVEASARVVRRLNLSGFVGFDFMIEARSGNSYLIEMNPRATALSQFAPAIGPDPGACYAEAIAGIFMAPRPRLPSDLISLGGTAAPVQAEPMAVAA